MAGWFTTRTVWIFLMTTLLCTFLGFAASQPPDLFSKFMYYEKEVPGFTFSCPDSDWERRGTTCFKVFSTPRSWEDAKTECINVGGHLVKIFEPTLNLMIGQLVLSKLGKTNDYWTGLHVPEISSSDMTAALWSDGQESNLATGRWAVGQPDRTDGLCVKVVHDADQYYYWSLEFCTQELPFVCSIKACSNGQYKCLSGECIDDTYLCDGTSNCKDGSDERNCPGTSPGCMRVLKGDSGTLTSPNYPGNYANTVKCMWTIEASVGTRVQFQFNDFMTEKYLDPVVVWIGGSTISTSMHALTLSGHLSSPPTVISTNNLMILTFESDAMESRRGFKGNWNTAFKCEMKSQPDFQQQLPAKYIKETLTNRNVGTCQSTCLNDEGCDAFTYIKNERKCLMHSLIYMPVATTDGCCDYYAKTCPGKSGISEVNELPSGGGILSASSDPQVLMSPFYPFRYLSNLRLSYTIKVKQFLIITMERLDVDLADGDKVIIYNGDRPTDADVLAEYILDGKTGDKALQVVSTSKNNAYFAFNTQSPSPGRGYQFTYEIGCNVEFKGVDLGVFASPGYPNDYPALQTCTWKIETTGSVLLTFTECGLMNIAPSDTLQVFKGVDDTGTPVYSGNGYSGLGCPNNPLKIDASDGKLFVQLKTDALTNARGFKAEFSKACPNPNFNNVTKDNRAVESYNYQSVIDVTCEDGYYFAAEEFQLEGGGSKDTVRMECMLGGIWNVIRTPQCSRRYCGSIPEVDNGYVSSVTSVEYEGQATYKCVGGFTLQGTSDICNDQGKWDQNVGCASMECTPLTPPTNGEITFNNTVTKVTYGTVATYSCNPGFQLSTRNGGATSLLCNDTWSDAPPQCTKISCSIPPFENGSTDKQGSSVLFEENVILNCNTGYELNGTATFRCNATGGFEDLPFCQNVDECAGTSHGCSNDCVDTQGSYQCTCPPGYRLGSDKKTCEDINECEEIHVNAGCSHNCTNFAGGYNCSCLDGYELFKEDGFNGFNIRSPETGLNVMDTLYINHTCIFRTCPKPPTQISNGRILVRNTVQYFYFGQTVEVMCNLGFKVNGTDNISRTDATCQSDGTWDKPWLSCDVAKCAALVIPPTVRNKPTIIPDGQDIPYGGKVTLNCTVKGKDDFQRELQCLYDVSEKKYALLGDPLDCGVIDCGNPEAVPGMKSSPPITTYDTTFEFVCQDGFTADGNSSYGDRTVRCEVDGRWDFGGLQCLGPVCSDPGRCPGCIQHAVSYEEGQIVSYSCNRTGYKVSQDSPLLCESDGAGGLKWNASFPQCIDVEPPTFENCNSEPVTVALYGSIGNIVPVATDNTGVTSITPDVDTYRPVTMNMNVTWIAKDYAGNEAECVTIVQLKDEDPPRLVSSLPGPSNQVIELNEIDESSMVEVAKMDKLSVYPGLAVDDGSGVLETKFEPSHISVNSATLNKVFPVTFSITDRAGNELLFFFTITVKAAPCKTWSLRTPANGNKNCIDVKDGAGKITGQACNITCIDGYTFYEQPQPLALKCDTGMEWPNTYVPDCIKSQPASYQSKVTITYHNENVPVSVPNTACRTTLEANIQSKLSSAASDIRSNCAAVQNFADVKIETFEAVPNFVTQKYDVTYAIDYGLYAQNIANIFYCASQIIAIEVPKANVNPGSSAISKLTEINGGATECEGLQKMTVASTSADAANWVCGDGLLKQTVVDSNFPSQEGAVCVPCPPGRYGNGTSCLLCSKGTYQNAQAQESCKNCPDGTTTEGEGSLSLDSCRSECQPGYTSADRLNECMPCPANTYWAAADKCEDCPDGTSSRAASKNISDCQDLVVCRPNCSMFVISRLRKSCEWKYNVNTIGSLSWAGRKKPVDIVIYIDACAPGYISAHGYEPCSPCPQGFYKENPGPGSCTECPNGQGTGGEGATLAANCTNIRDEICVSGFCENGGTCQVDNHRGTCDCLPGYAGQHCETNFNECSSNPCYHGGVCVDEINGYKCLCANRTRIVLEAETVPHELDGDFEKGINVDFETCKEMCLNDSLCKRIAFVNTNQLCLIYYKVNALEGSGTDELTLTKKNVVEPAFSGIHCEEEPNDCDLNPGACKNGGMCKDLISDFECLCLINGGSSGARCDQMLDICETAPCSINAVSCDKISAIRRRCQCSDGFEGPDCSMNIDECASNPCLNGGTCADGINRFTCNCPSGFLGARCDERPANLCSGNPCTQNGFCVEDYTESEAECICDDGYTTGDYTEIWKDSDDPSDDGDDESVLRHKNENACQGTDPVGILCRVKNTKEPYDQTGQVFEEACTLTGGLVCLNANQTGNNTCFDYEVQFTCSVRKVFASDRCFQENDCSSEPCENGAPCINLVNNYRCECLEGYTGAVCQVDINECASNPCQNDGTCMNLVNAYNCSCPTGFSGELCEVNADDCNPNLCDAAGADSCVDGSNDYSCVCKPGYKGKNCSEDVNECTIGADPCEHEGICVDQVNGYSCNCTSGFTGDNCEMPLDLCGSNECKNGAECYTVSSDYFCACEGHFHGKLCEEDPDVCTVANHCKNGGTCFIKDGKAKCDCNADFVGEGCQHPRDYCGVNNICQNEGKCSYVPGGYLCNCLEGYTGTNCETNIDDCAGISCQNGGSCIDGVGKAICNCPPELDGETCNKAADTNYDLVFPGSGHTTMLHPFVLNATNITIGLWVKYDKENPTGNPYCLFSTETITSTAVSEQLLCLDESSLSVNFNGNVKIFGHDPSTAQLLTDGNWNFFTFTWSNTDGRIKSNVGIVEDINVEGYEIGYTLPLYGIVQLGSRYVVATGMYDKSFIGEVSQVNMWSRVLNKDTEISALVNQDSTAIQQLLGADSIHGFSGFEVVGAVLRRFISKVCVGTGCSSSQAQNLPSFKAGTCPAHVAAVAEDVLVVTVDWSEPQAENAKQVARNHVPGNPLNRGIINAQYIATATSGTSTDVCEFLVIVRLKDCPQPASPLDGSLTDANCKTHGGGLLKSCKPECNSGRAFMRPIPELFTCGYSGVWDLAAPLSPYKLPPCGTTGTTKLTLVFGWTYNLIVEATDSLINIIKTRVLGKLQAWNSELKAGGNLGICEGDCSELTIKVYKTNDPLGLAVVDVFAAASGDTVQVEVSGKNIPIEVGGGIDTEGAITAAVQEGKFDLEKVGGAETIDKQSLFINKGISCDPGYQAVNDQCVGCTKGTYFNETAETCIDCPKGYFTDTETTINPTNFVRNCTYCGDGQTTASAASISASDCFANCPSGQFYDETSTKCEPCSRNFYQPLEGATFCEPCPAGQITRQNGSVSKEDCRDDCPSGQQATGVDECQNCSVGSYRRKGIDNTCQPCQADRTTKDKGAGHPDDCSRIVCPAGEFRVGDDPGQCEPCPIGTFRNTSMENCTVCGNLDEWRTDNNGSTSEDQCKRFCPAGFYLKTDANNVTTCEACERNYYKTTEKYYENKCTPCPSDKPRTQNPASTSPDDCRFGNCTAGQVVNPDFLNGQTDAVECKTCPFGTFQPNEEPTTDNCTACAEGYSTEQMGAKSQDACKRFCISGEELNTSSICVPCPRGYFKDNAISDTAKFETCSLCANGKITATVGATTAALCTVANCTAGQKRIAASETCALCPNGTYQSEKWQDQCIACDPEYTTLNEGGTTPDDCNVTPNRTRYQFQFIILEKDCKDGYLDEASSVYKTLKQKLENYFTNNINVAGFKDARVVVFGCGSVPVHMVVSLDRTTGNLTELVMAIQNILDQGVVDGERVSPTLIFVPLNDGDTPCTGGNYLDYTATDPNKRCLPCTIGSYQPTGLSHICVKCEDGFNTTSAGLEGDEATVCKRTCPPGQEQDQSKNCVNCPNGEYKSEDGVAECTPCGNGLATEVSGATSANQCIAKCSAGNRSVSEGAEKKCQPCPRNTYSDKENSVTCTSCAGSRQTIAEGSHSKSMCLSPCDDKLTQTYCQNSGSCTFDPVTDTALCICKEPYQGSFCQVRGDAQSDTALIIGLVVGLTGGVLLLVLIVVCVCVIRRNRQEPPKERFGYYPLPIRNTNGPLGPPPEGPVYNPMGVPGFPPPYNKPHPPRHAGDSPGQTVNRVQAPFMFYEDADMDFSASQVRGGGFSGSSTFFQPKRK